MAWQNCLYLCTASFAQGKPGIIQGKFQGRPKGGKLEQGQGRYWLQFVESRNPSGTLLPFLGSGFPYIIYQQKKGYPYCNMVTGLPRNIFKV